MQEIAKKKKKFDGFVFSTDPDFEFDNEIEEQETLEPKQQNLKVYHDRKQRKGKTVTIVEGFVGSESDRLDLCKLLKSKCGVGGSSKDGLIIIQGAVADKVLKNVLELGYKAKKSGG
jgi:translation initiation factor 1